MARETLESRKQRQPISSQPTPPPPLQPTPPPPANPEGEVGWKGGVWLAEGGVGGVLAGRVGKGGGLVEVIDDGTSTNRSHKRKIRAS